MDEPFIGSEAVNSGRLRKYTLYNGFRCLYPDVYVATDVAITPAMRARAAWLWSRRRGIVAGRSAAALHGTRWIDGRDPAELLYDYRRPPRGIQTWSDSLGDGEAQSLAGMLITTPARTALDIACRYPVEKAVAAIDALVRATKLEMADVELLAARYKGRRGIRRARRVLQMIDGGAESPRETWLRLLLIRAGFAPPQTQIQVRDEFGQIVAVLDMGWENTKLAVEYDGDQHRTDRRQFNKDIHRLEDVTELGWVVVRVTAEDTEGGIVARVRAAQARRACTQFELANRLSN